MGQRHGVRMPSDTGQIDSPVPALRARRDGADLDRPAAALGQDIGMLLQQLDGAGTYRAEARDPDLEGLAHAVAAFRRRAARRPAGRRRSPLIKYVIVATTCLMGNPV